MTILSGSSPAQTPASLVTPHLVALYHHFLRLAPVVGYPEPEEPTCKYLQ
ncbi:MAG: hypothetical protein IJP77_04745 [Bacteroidales bacterium]|nr:hypothetical protein [Bacteroidales bacterium]